MISAILLPLLFAATPSWQTFEAQSLPSNSLKLLTDGKTLTAERLELIDNAQDSIAIATFEITQDQSSMTIVNHLCTKAKEGIDVRLLLDSFGSKPFKRVARLLRACGARVLFYNPFNWGLLDFRETLHEKFLGVDGHAALIGGSNYKDDYSDHSFESTRWHDLDVRIDGPAACWFHYRFQREWKRVATMELRPVRQLFWDARGQALLERKFGLKSFRPCKFTQNAGNVRVFPIQQDPIFEHNHWLLKTHLRAIRASQHSIRLYAPYFTPHKELLRALLDARARGVEVTILTNSALSVDDGSTYQGMLRIAEPLLRAGVRILLWHRPGVFHRKGGIYDNRWSYLGSDNLDRAAHVYNTENLAFTDDPETARELGELMDRDAAASIPLTLELRKEEYDRHSWWSHVKIWFISRYL